MAIVSAYATAFISGLQGKGGADPRYLLVASTAKHFVGAQGWGCEELRRSSLGREVLRGVASANLGGSSVHLNVVACSPSLLTPHPAGYDLEGYIPRSDPLPRPPSSTCDTPGGCQRWVRGGWLHPGGLSAMGEGGSATLAQG